MGQVHEEGAVQREPHHWRVCLTVFSEAFRVPAPWTSGPAGHLGKTLGLLPGTARVACELVTRVSQSIRDFLSEPQSELVLFPFTPVLLHLTCPPCVSPLLCVSLAPRCVGGGQH